MDKLYTKPTVSQRLPGFITSNAYIIMVVLAILVSVTLMVVLHKPTEYIKAPAQFCKSAYTGQQRTEGYYTYQCAAYNKDMVCTMQIPIYNEYTYQAVNTVCNWTEWR